MFQDLPGGTEQTARRHLNWRAALGAGIGAGILATGLQIGLWAAFSSGLPEIFFRDARLAAAIVMGPKVLAPPATLDWYVMLIATLVHFTLSIAYGLILSRLIVFLGTPSSLLAGAVFGLLLYALNMYGFTSIFPWFEAARDWITAVTHAAFGIAVAGLYRVCAGR
jgi:hypothetical protein